MKTKLFFIIFLGSFVINAQNLKDNTSEIINDYFKNQLITKSFIPDFVNKTETVSAINQLGNDNFNYINTNSLNSQEIIQTGNSNSFQMMTYFNSDPMKINVLQNGNNNNIQVFGQNELMENMVILQNANNQSIIINNF